MESEEMDVDEDICLSDLPRELLGIILSELDAPSQQRIRRVCPLWDELITDPYGDCRRQVQFELNPLGQIEPGEVIGPPYYISPGRVFSLCVGKETKDVVFFQPQPLACWSFSGYLHLMIALRNRVQQIKNDGHPMILRRLIFANLTLPSVAISRTVFCCPDMVKEVWLRNVTLIATLELNGPFCMEILGVNQRYNTTRDVEPFGGRGTLDDYTWAKYVAECGGPLSAVEEQVVLESLRNETLAEKLSEELQDGDVAETFYNHFWGEFESMEAKDFSLEWLRKFDVWTLRFLFHYFVSVCNVQPMQP